MSTCTYCPSSFERENVEVLMRLIPLIFRASERGESPAPIASLNHSYETLNMSDSGSNHEASTISMMGPAPTRRLPHRPAPPVPVREQFERSKEILFNNPKRKLDLRIPGHKKNLRFRKIHSLKRQILIKEKMLEVLTYN